MSDTPRTDAAFFSATTEKPSSGDFELCVVDVDFARKLERELANTTPQLAAWGETTKRQAAMLNDAAVALGKDQGMGFNIVLFCKEAAERLAKAEMERGAERVNYQVADDENRRLRAALKFCHDIAAEELPHARVGTGHEVALRHIVRRAGEAL